MNSKIKRITILILALTVMNIFCVGSYAEEGEKCVLNSDEYNALRAIGVFDNTTVGTDASSFITRAQYVGALSNMAGADAMSFDREEVSFIDVNDNTQYASAIYGFYKLGYVTGTSSTTFSPNKSITYAQAIKILVKVLGYGDLSVKKYGDNEFGYCNMGNELKLMKNVKITDFNNPMTWENAATLLYNAGITSVLNENTYSITTGVTYGKDSDKTLLSVNNDVYYGEGILRGNGIVSLAIGSDNDNIALIDDEEYISHTFEFTKYVGCQVKFLYKKDSGDDKTLLWVKNTKRNNILNIKADCLLTNDADYGLTNIVYEENNKKCSANVSGYADIMYNNNATENYDIGLIKPASGGIRLIDNNGDNKYEVVIVENYVNIFADAISVSNNFIADKYGDTLYLDDYKYVRFIKDGALVQIQDVESNCVLSYEKNQKEDTMFIYVNPQGTSGKLQEINNEGNSTTYKFESGEYKLAASYRALMENDNYNAVSMAVGEQYKYYLDKNGDISELREEFGERLQYALLINAVKGEGLSGEGRAELKFLLQNGTMLTAKTKKKIKLNGDKGKSGADLLSDSRLKSGGEVCVQVVKLSLNTEGEITEFSFCEPCSSQYGYENDKFTLDYDNPKCIFYTENNFTFDSKYTINPSTVCFVKYTDLNERDPYYVLNPKMLSHESTYNVKIYDSNEKLEAGVIFVKRGIKGTDSKFFLVDKVTYMSVNKESTPCISGLYNGSYQNILVDDECKSVSDLKRGDVIRIAMWDSKIVNFDIVVSLSEKPQPFINHSKVNTENTILFEDIYSASDNNVVTVNPSTETDALTVTALREWYYNIPIYVYNCRTDEVSIGTREDFYQSYTHDKDGNPISNENKTMILLQQRHGYSYMEQAVVVYY